MPVPNCLRGYLSFSPSELRRKELGVPANSYEMFGVKVIWGGSEICSCLGPVTSFLPHCSSKIPNWDLCAKEELGIYLGMIAAGRVGRVLASLLLVSYPAQVHFRHATLIVVRSNGSVASRNRARGCIWMSPTRVRPSPSLPSMSTA